MDLYEKLNKFSEYGAICSPMETNIQIKKKKSTSIHFFLGEIKIHNTFFLGEIKIHNTFFMGER
jgi:hypothetical protein